MQEKKKRAEERREQEAAVRRERISRDSTSEARKFGSRRADVYATVENPQNASSVSHSTQSLGEVRRFGASDEAEPFAKISNPYTES